ncbi:MAG: hypothetical protein ACOYWZ_01290 [Bacillota bacterium]
MENINEAVVNTGTRHSYYKHSGAFSPMGPIIILVLGTIGTTILSLIYSYAIYYIPFVYLNFLIAIGFGFGAGFIVGMGGKLGKVRNTSIMTLFGVIIGLFAQYAQWVFWIFAYSKQQLLFTNPVDIFAIMKLLAVEGVWSIRSFTPTGAFLYVIWFLEAVIIIGTSTITARTLLNDSAFCEKCNIWVDNKEFIDPLDYVNDSEELRNQLEQGNFSALSLLKKAELGSNQYTTVELLSCKDCKDFYLVTVKSVMISKNSKGEEKKDEKVIVENLIIDSRVYNSIKLWSNSIKETISSL